MYSLLSVFNSVQHCVCVCIRYMCICICVGDQISMEEMIMYISHYSNKNGVHATYNVVLISFHPSRRELKSHTFS